MTTTQANNELFADRWKQQMIREIVSKENENAIIVFEFNARHMEWESTEPQQ